MSLELRSAETAAVEFRIRGLEEVVNTIGYIPAVLTAFIANVNFEALDRHRRAILKYNRFPAKRKAQQALAASLHRYGRKFPDPVELSDATGEGFFAGGYLGDLGPDYGKALEYGADITADTPFIVPVGAGRTVGGATNKTLARMLKEKKLSAILRKGKHPLLVRMVEGKRARWTIYGILTFKRRQRPMLDFFKNWNDTEARFGPEYDKAIAMALTESGRQAMRQRTSNDEERLTAYRSGYAAERSRLLAAGILDKRKLRAASRIAGKTAERAFITGGNA